MDKPTIALALDGPKKPMGPPMAALGEEADEGPEPPSDGETDPSLVEAYQAVKAAFQGGDDEDGAKALQGFIKLCGDY
jgi:hypothetical protein